VETDHQRDCTLITGASSGLGAAIARTLSSRHVLAVHGRDQARLSQVLASCERAEAHRFWTQDLAQTGQVAASFADFTRQQKLSVRNFIHCAGEVAVTAARQSDLAQARRLFGVNVFSVFALLPVLLAQGTLRNIVLVSSAASLCGEKGVALYSATKGAVNALVKSLAVELGPAVRVNAILPGLTDTPMVQGTLANPEALSQLKSIYPLGFGEPADTSAAATFLLSDAAAWMTGALLVVDGGRTLV
jgi:NAD(P)-dependent dehydrogenase (short-subunit alcohol dehydrogenase family)